uniref:hypothetical protein n=1 Tax=Bradyrhizobium sp. th-b2 TaxID=172088 RepID=UPI001AEC334E
IGGSHHIVIDRFTTVSLNGDLKCEDFCFLIRAQRLDGLLRIGDRPPSVGLLGHGDPCHVRVNANSASFSII